MLDLARRTRFRWGLHPRLAVADKKYGTVPNIVGLEQDGIRAYLGRPDYRQRHKVFSSEQFRYDREHDHFTCPAGEVLPRSSFDRQRQVFMYRTSAKICQACHLKPQCTTSSHARVVVRSIHQEYIDRVRRYHTTPAYHKAQRKRSVWVEPMFGEAKQWHNLQKFRWRGLLKVNMQALLTATGQNIKRLLNHTPPHRQPDPLIPNVNALPCSLLDFVSAVFNFALGPLFSTGCSDTEHQNRSDTSVSRISARSFIPHSAEYYRGDSKRRFIQCPDTLTSYGWFRRSCGSYAPS